VDVLVMSDPLYWQRATCTCLVMI